MDVTNFDLAQLIGSPVGKELLKRILGASKDAICVLDGSGLVIQANSACSEIFGQNEVVGRKMAELSKEENKFFYSLERVCLHYKPNSYECRETLSDDRTFLRTITPIIHDGQLEGFLLISRDITEEKNRSLADDLTGLLNRRGWRHEISHALSLCARNKKPGVVVVADIDGLKFVNDSRGHQQGDLLIRTVAITLKGAIRGSDIIARIGGDEFYLFFPEADNAAAIVEHLRNKIDVHNQVSAVPFQLSLGAAIWHSKDNMDNVIKLADDVMYQNKKARKNCRTK